MNHHPQWLKKRLYFNDSFFETKNIISGHSVNTVCESARCPNMSECYSRKFATFMMLGRACTRTCAFCSVKKTETEPVDIGEPGRIAGCVGRLGLRYVILTSVTRDDLEDGGSSQFVKAVYSVRNVSRETIIELLIPDFAGDANSIKAAVLSGADIIGHNIETVKRLYPVVRKEADYSRSLEVLKTIKEINPEVITKSAILAGMGEREGEIIHAMEDLRAAGCDILAIGQYLRPSETNHPVDRFVAPEEFDRLRRSGIALGFKNVSAGPFVRSSYLAEEAFSAVSYKL